MTVYVDLLFLLNASINYLLLRGSAVLGGCPAPVSRLLGAAVLGGLYAVGTVVPGLAWLRALPIQGVCAVLMLLLAFGWKRYTVKQGLFFFALSFAFGGAVLLVMTWLEPDCLILGGRAYYAVTTPALLLLAGALYGLSALVLQGWGAHTGGEIQTMTLTVQGRSRELRVLRDTGNTLRDPMTGQTVLVAGWQVLAELLQTALHREHFTDPGALLQQLSRQYPELRFCLVPYRTVGVEQGLLLALRCQLTWGNRREAILAAFSPTTVGQEGQFEAIWGGELR